jgi:hypothetical protein
MQLSSDLSHVHATIILWTPAVTHVRVNNVPCAAMHLVMLLSFLIDPVVDLSASQKQAHAQQFTWQS